MPPKAKSLSPPPPSPRRPSLLIFGWVFLGLLLAAAFSPVILGRQTLLTLQPGVMPDGPFGYEGPRPEAAVYDPAASAIKYVPYTKFVSEKWRRLEIPFWNPYAGCGVPLLANAESFATSPLRIPLYVSPTPLTWDFYYLFRLFLAGGLGFSLALSLGLSVTASIAAGVAWMLGGYLILSLNLFHLDVDIFLPGLLFVLDRLVIRPSPAAFLGTFVISWQMCLGGNQQALLVDLLLCAFWIVMRLSAARKGAALPALIRTGLALGAGAAGALFHWFPLLELVTRAHHLHSPLGPRSGLSCVPASSLVSIFMPPASRPAFYYAGVSVCLLAAAGIFSAFRRSRRASDAPRRPFKLMTAAVLLEIAKIGGVPGVALVGVLPLFSNVWWIKYAAPLFLGLALLAGRGVDALAGFLPRKARTAAAAAALILVSAELAILKPGPYAARHDPLRPAPYISWLASRLDKEPQARICGVGTTLMPMLATAFHIPDVRMEDTLIDRAQYRLLYEGFSAPKPAKLSMFMTLDKLDSRRLASLKGLGVRYLLAPAGFSPPAETAADLSLSYDAEIRIYQVLGSRPFAGFPPRGMRTFALGLLASITLSTALLLIGIRVTTHKQNPFAPGAKG